MPIQLMEVTIKGLSAGQQAIRRLNFMANIAGPAVPILSTVLLAGLMGDGIGGGDAPDSDSVLQELMAAKSVNESLTEIVIRDVYNENDLLTVPLTNAAYMGVQGTVGAMQQNFVVTKIRTNRTQQGIKAGSMVVGQVPDSQVNDLAVLTGAWITVLQDLCTALEMPNTIISGASSVTFESVVVQKERYGIEHVAPKPSTFAYRYYEDDAIQATHIMHGVIWSPVTTARSQVSLKIGKGS